MSREVKRVEAGFSWPVDKIWPGYVGWFSPPKCEACDGTGYNRAAHDVYFKVVDANRPDSGKSYTNAHEEVNRQFPDRTWACEWCSGKGEHRPKDPAVLKALEPFMEDGGYSFPKEHPPEGEWWQLWETVSEGSPITPAFPTAEGLAGYCEQHQFDDKTPGLSKGWNRLAGGFTRLTYEQWLKFLTECGSAPSTVIEDGTMKSGVEYLACGEDVK